MLLFGKEANVEIGDDHRALDQAEGRLPHKADAPAQQRTPGHSPGNVLLREDVQDHIQQDPAHHEGQQIPHGPAGEKFLPEILCRVGQAQQKTAGDLDRLANGAGQVLERFIVDDKVQHAGEQRSIEVRLEQTFQLLLDAFADGALAEAVAAGDKESGHQRFAVDEREKRGQGQAADRLHGIKLGGMRKNDGQHTGTLEHVEHADGAGGAGLGSFHGGSFLARDIPSEPDAAQCVDFE